MKTKSKRTLTPRLRFPEFQNKGEWEEKALAVLTDPVAERVGDSDCVPYTVTSGEGLISQKEKYGRTIAGKSLKNYYRIKRDDFAFNKSATKSFPQGYIARFQENERAAVPNSIFKCFRIADENVDAAYLDYLFQGNLHGRWLKDYITVGARAHGALNISDDDLYALPIPLPAGDETKAEQQKIADCLGSLDGLIAAEGWKLAALRDHKRGLIQQLFPQPGQTHPRLRFPEFRNKGEWEEKAIAEIAALRNGFAFKSSTYVENGRYMIITIRNVQAGALLTEDMKTISELPKDLQLHQHLQVGEILISLTGNVGRTCRVDVQDCLLNQRVGKLEPRAINKEFFYQSLNNEKFRASMQSRAAGGAQGNISSSAIEEYVLHIPKNESEQQKIADCLSSLDTLIAAQSEKIDALKTHKKGLMQQLFPAPEEP